MNMLTIPTVVFVDQLPPDYSTEITTLSSKNTAKDSGADPEIEEVGGHT